MGLNPWYDWAKAYFDGIKKNIQKNPNVLKCN